MGAQKKLALAIPCSANKSAVVEVPSFPEEELEDALVQLGRDAGGDRQWKRAHNDFSFVPISVVPVVPPIVVIPVYVIRAHDGGSVMR